MFTKQDQRWVFHKDALAQDAGPGVTRRVLAYNSQLMCVENHFEQGAVGPAHSHPHTQITYVASGRFAFTIDGETHEVGPGDTLLNRRRSSWLHLPGGGCSAGHLQPHAGGFPSPEVTINPKTEDGAPARARRGPVYAEPLPCCLLGYILEAVPVHTAAGQQHIV